MLHAVTMLYVLHQPIHSAGAKTHFTVSNPKQGFNLNRVECSTSTQNTALKSILYNY